MGREQPIRQRPRYAWEISKRSFISTVRTTVLTNPDRKRTFTKTRFSVSAWRGSVLKTEVFENDVINPNPRGWFLSPVIVAFSNLSGVVWTKDICCVFGVKIPFSNFSGVVWTENIWCVFGVKMSFSNFSSVVWTGPRSPLNAETRHPVGHSRSLLSTMLLLMSIRVNTYTPNDLNFQTMHALSDLDYE